MSSLFNKRILLGVTGGIAAYKSAEIIRRLQDRGADVRVVMTKAAQEFITPLTLQALSGNPVHTDLLDPKAEAAMGHIALARWADLVLIVPASADFIARLTQGRGDDLLSTLCLATKSPIALAPAMNQGMWHNVATQENLSALRERGVQLFGPAQGLQACGEVGLGRMLEPEEIANCAAQLFQTGVLAGKRVLITAGPTREALDPVRYLSNHSSGKMGYALAQAAQEAGAEVILVSGPTNLTVPERVRLIPVVSAEQMLQACAAETFDVLIAAAAVADFRPRVVADQKIKKSNRLSSNKSVAGSHESTQDQSENDADKWVLELVQNPDIVATLAQQNPQAFCVGFAAETENLLVHAQEKLKRKNLDMVIGNNVSHQAIGFNSDDNEVTVMTARPLKGEQSEKGERDTQGKTTWDFSQRSKTQLARELIALIARAATAKN